MKKKIVTFGSFIVDMMGRGSHLPSPGETVKSGFFKMSAGGKGFNQAVAAFKSGGDVTMVTKLGQDAFADIALNMMAELGMDTSRILRTSDYSTGIALIHVDETTAQNAIMVIPSACDHIEESEIGTLSDLIQESDILLTQLETNIESVEKIIDMAYRAGKTVVLNTAPVQPVSDELLKKVSIVTPNEIEAGILTGVKVTDAVSASRAAAYFYEKGVKNVIITLGSFGAYVSDGTAERIIPAFKVDAVDTTGAGDAFNGGLVTALSDGRDIFEAGIFASAVAALSVQKVGAAPSMPTREETEEFLRKHQA